MKLTFKETVATIHSCYKAKKTYDVDEVLGHEFIKAGFATVAGGAIEIRPVESIVKTVEPKAEPKAKRVKNA